MEPNQYLSGRRVFAGDNRSIGCRYMDHLTGYTILLAR